MALSAADLQRRHELEGAPDPFPSLTEPASQSRRQAGGTQELDTESQAAFPSLASAAPSAAPAPAPAWGSTAGPRIRSAVSKQPLASDTFTVTQIDLSTAGKDGKPITVGEIIKHTMAKYKVKIEASGNQKSRQTTFHLKSESQKELERAKRALLAGLSPVVTLTIQAPVSTIASIIGPKGATLNKIRDQTGVKVDIPPKESITNGNGQANGASSGKASPSQDDDEEPSVPIKVTGPQPLATEAQELLNAIISSKTATSTQRVRDIPANVLPFVLARRQEFLSAAQSADIKLSLSAAEREITVSGEREAVGRVIESIKSTVETFKTNITSLKISLPKRQHRLLVGKAIDEIMAKSKCAVIVPKPDDSSDEVAVWGQAADLAVGLQAVMEQANSKYIHEFPLPGPIALSRQLCTYMVRVNYPQTLKTAHPEVSVFTPSASSMEKSQVLNVEIVGEKADVDSVVSKVSALIGKLIGATKDVSIDWIVHRVIQGKSAKKLKQFHDTHNVSVYFPPESAEQSSVLLVYDPFSPNASPSPDEKQRHLEDVSKELLKLAKDAAEVKTESVSVEKRWHSAILGPGGTTLNAIIGEEKALSIKVGAEAADPSGEDTVVVRGAAQDVDRAVAEILEIVERAKNDEIDNSYSTEFEIDREFVSRIVGAQGAGVNRLRDQLGVKVDISDEGDEKEKESKKKKGTHQKSKVKITGRKENVEEAKRRITTQLERLADETTEILKIPSQYHSSLIGASGKYAIRLEEKYGVKITFPRQSADNTEGKTREQLKSDEVLVKGGKKGVASAKSELLDALEFEKESNNVLKFTVPTRSVARILGRGGSSINEIKDNTDTQIDVDKATEDTSITNITVRGTKKGIAAAKTAILAIADTVTEETTVTVTVESKYHRSLIGAGGQGLRDLASRCGISADNKVLAGLIKFPKQGEPSDEVKLRGDPKLVSKIQAELEKAVATLRDRVVLAVEIHSAQHRALIGRGGQHLNDLQARTGTQVQFPGSRSYGQTGKAENADEFKDVDEADIVKVTGTRSACESAIAELKASVRPAAPELITDTIEVPLKYHHAISQQGNFFRTLRSFGVQVDQSAHPQKSAVPTQPPAPSSESAARIDDAEDEASPAVQWQVSSNYQDAEEGESTWTLKARDQAGLDRARKMVEEAIAQAEKMTSAGFLTLPDRSMFPRIVGAKGSTVARLRNETGADITVSRENSTIVIIGTETDIEAAKEAILKIVANSDGRPPRRR